MSRKNQNKKQARKQAQARRRQQRREQLAESSFESDLDGKKVLTVGFLGEDGTAMRVFAYYPDEKVACLYPTEGNTGIAVQNVPYELGKHLWEIFDTSQNLEDYEAAGAELTSHETLPLVYGNIDGDGCLMYPGGKPMQAPPIRVKSLETRDYIDDDPSTVLPFTDAMGRLNLIYPHGDLAFMYPDVDMSIVNQHESEFSDDTYAAIDHYFPGTKVVVGLVGRTENNVFICYGDGCLMGVANITPEALAAFD